MILDSNAVSKKIFKSVSEEVKALEKENIKPTLALVRIGSDLGSISYENSIKKKLEPLGINVISKVYEPDISEKEFIKELEALNQDESINSILLFKPLPAHFNENEIISRIDASKDVDALNPINLGKLLIGDSSGFIPCTPEGVMELLDYYDIDIKGKDIVIINNSDIIGKPLSLLLTNEFGTVTLCHVFTKDLEEKTRNADIIITGVGKYGLLTPEMVNENATVIDVAVSKMTDSSGNPILDENKKPIRAGDVSIGVKDKVKNITSLTPDSGTGTGPLTTALLARNVVKATKLQREG